MRLLALILSLVVASPALACIILPRDGSAAFYRQNSEAVVVDAQCAMTNGGVFDYQTLGPAQDLGNGRVMQVINGSAHRVLLGDCATREATVLYGPVLGVDYEFATSCGPNVEYGALSGDQPHISMAQGDDLHELVAIAQAAGAREYNPIELFFEFTTDRNDRVHRVGRRDRFDLLCGCGLYYPSSPGASG